MPIHYKSQFYKLKHKLSVSQHPLLHSGTIKKWVYVYNCIDDPSSRFFHIKLSTAQGLLLKLSFIAFCIFSNRYFC